MKKRIVILGAGPAGLWTALTLLRENPGLDVAVVEKEEVPGGITASFRHAGITFDYGSHRLHPSTSPEILGSIRSMLGRDLLKRPRNGRIFLEGRLISFPLKPLDLMFNLPPSFSLGFAADLLTTPFRRGREGRTFREALIRGLGRTISTRFYFPYARKLWGLPPDRISPVQARKRIASGNISGMIRKAFSSLHGPEEAGSFYYYPREGFGQIALRTAEEITGLGGRVICGSSAVTVRVPNGKGEGTVVLDNGRALPADFVFSTIPVSHLTGMMEPAAPSCVTGAASFLSWRSMVFCCVEVAGSSYSEYDAHYFPGPETCFSRMSEPANYSMSGTADQHTGLCFEIPCSETDDLWSMDPDQVLQRVVDDLEITGLPIPRVLSHTVRRLSGVYPVYDLLYSERLREIEAFLQSLPGLVTLGRQGLFVHDNTHHTIEMGIAAARCLGPELAWDGDRWAGYRKQFEAHVVVD